MCIVRVMSSFGVPVSYDPDRPPVTQQLRDIVEGNIPEIKPISFRPRRIQIERPVAGLSYSGRPCRMGSALSGQKMIRGY